MNKAYHEPVLLHECIEGLNLKPGGVYLDLTFGGGGHSREILKQLKKGWLLAFDQDEEALKNIWDDKRLQQVHGNFRYLKNYLRYYKIVQVDGIMADLGVSSHHFNIPERGFSYKTDAGLDMRMNQEAELSAEVVLNTYTEEHLRKIFREYGELKNAYRLAKDITSYRKNIPLKVTNDLLQAISGCIPKKIENKYLAQVFQAIRIEVNQELEALKLMLTQSAEVVKTGGRLVIITYHSLEDRLVKNFIKAGNFKGEVDTDLYGNVMAPFTPVTRNVIVPTGKEIEKNSRARSAKLRIAEKNG